jgi:RNA recognition motif-containing protein
MHEKDIRGKKVEINRHEKKEKREPAGSTKFNNLFVKNLPPGTDDTKLKELFGKFGEIESATV